MRIIKVYHGFKYGVDGQSNVAERAKSVGTGHARTRHRIAEDSLRGVDV